MVTQSNRTGSRPCVDTAKTGAAIAYPAMPLEFEANRGQAPADYAFVAHGASYALGLSATDMALSVHRAHGTDKRWMDAAELHLKLMGASKGAAFVGTDPRPGVSNYFLGSDPSQWKTNVPHFGRVEMAKVYPGIDLVFYGNPQQLEYDFRVAPGADSRAIRLDVSGATSTHLDADGNLILATGAGNVALKHPVAYQEVAGVREQVRSDFRLVARNTVEFAVGEYDHALPLVIDPVLLYAVAIGGSNGNEAIGLDVDANGNAYVAGNTCSADFPANAGSFSSVHTNILLPACQDAFVMKLDATASTLLYSDYIGGSVAQTAAHITVDASGAAYVAGATGSNNFPLVNNIGPAGPVPCGSSKAGFNCSMGFIFKLSPDGSQLLFSSLLGGSQSNGALQAKLSPVSGDLLVLGVTNSSDFRPVATTLETSYAGGTCPSATPCQNSFLLGLNPATGALKYGTLFGSSGYLVLTGLATDTTGEIYVTGSTKGTPSSALGSVTQSYVPAGGAAAGGADALVARLHLAGTTLSTVYMTLIEGELDDSTSGISVDTAQNAYVVGSSASLHLPVTTGAFQSANTNLGGNSCLFQGPITAMFPAACGTGFVAKLTPTGTMSFLSYLGGNNQTWLQAIGVDSTGGIWLTGVTSASDFALSSDAYKSTGISNPGPFNHYTPFLAEMSNNGSALPFGSPIATSPGQSYDLKVDSSNNIYVTGFGSATPTTPGVYPPNPDVYKPVFVQKWNPGPQPLLLLSSSSLTFSGTPYGGTSTAQTVTAQNTGSGALELNLQLATSPYDPTLPTAFQESDNCGSTLAAGTSCKISVTFSPAAPLPTCLPSSGCNNSSPTGVILIQTNAAAGGQSIALGGTAGHGAALDIAPNPVAFGPQAAGTTSAALTVQVLSEGDLPLQVTGAAVTGPNAAEFQVSSLGTCVNPVAVGLIGCNLSVVFSPASTATGTRTATLILTDNAGNSPQSYPMTGIVTSTGPGLLVAPTSVYVGSAIIGTTTPSVQGSIVLTNPSSDTNVQVASLTLAGANKADFAILSGALPVTIAKGSSLALPVNFLPVAGANGLRSATLTVGTTPAVSGLPLVTLSGDALNPADSTLSLISVPSPQDFGGVQIGQSSQTGNNLLLIGAKQFGAFLCGASATSPCGGPLTITSFSAGLSDYSVSVSPGSAYCSLPPVTIPPGGNCYFSLTFTPTAAGNRNTILSINTNDPGGPTIMPLYGTGLALPLGSLSASVLNFGQSAIGLVSPPLTVTLTNFGQSNLSSSGFSIAGPFNVVSNTCTTALPPNSSCSFGIAFAPTSAGPAAGSLMITDNDYFNGQQTVALSGVGSSGPLLRITPNTVNFGNQRLGVASAQKTIVLANTGNGAVNFPANAMHLTNTDYSIVSNGCGTSLAQGASCSVVVQFKPTALYTDNGSLAITDNAFGNPQPIYFAGFGITASGTPKAALSSSANPSTTGQAVTFTATVAGQTAGSPVPTGTMQFFDYINLLGTQPLNGSGQASVTTSALTLGTHTVNGVYSGDSNYGSVNTLVVSQVVNAASSTPSTTALITTFNPGLTGQAIVFTATVTGSGGNTPVPTGSVAFFDGATKLATVTMNGAGQALYAFNAASNGSHSITAVYSGDGTYVTSTSSVLTQVVNTVAKGNTTTSLVSSLNPAIAGQSVTFTATVAGTTSNTPPPTGTIAFMDGTTLLVTAPLNGAGIATYSTSALTVGSHTLTAAYGADTNYAASTSGVVTEIVNAPAKVNTTTALISSLNPAIAGQSVTFTATVAGTTSNSPAPTGAVSFLDGTATLGTGTLNGAGVATYATSALTTGSHSISAVYGADSNYVGSTSGVLAEAINPVAKATSTTVLASSVNPSLTGQSVVLTATVAGTTSNTPVPTGTVTFVDGTTTLGIATLNGSSQASLTVSTLALGSHPISAAYGADTNYAGSTSGTLTQVVNAPPKGSTSTVVASSANPTTLGQTVALTATVTGTTSNTPLPTGTVTFLDGSAILGAGSLNGSGIATYSTSALAVGSHSITAQYSGDGVYLGSTSSVLSQSITVALNFSLAFSPTSLTVVRGQTGTTTITESTVGGFNTPATLACSGLPLSATCSFSPTTLAPAAGSSTASSILTISTNVQTGRNTGQPKLWPRTRGVWSASLMMGLGLILTMRGRRRLSSRLFLVSIAIAGALMATQLSGCGGGSSIVQTPTGTTTITVTATAGSTVQHSSFTLIVQ